MVKKNKFATKLHFFFHTFAGNMKKRSYIVLLALAIICMMMMVVVPHHHHAMKACLVQEICQQDGRVNDRHTQHSERTDTHHVIPITGKCLSIGSPSDLNDGQLTLTSFFLLGLLGINGGELRIPWFSIKRVHFGTQPAWHGQLLLSGHGLRAPPTSVL